MKKQRFFPGIELCWLGGVLLLGSLPAMAGELYRWIDATGRTHFSDRPPSAEARQVERGQLLQGTAPGPETGSLQSRQQRQRRLLNAMQEEREAKRRRKERRQQEEARRERRCSNARSRLASYRSSAIYRTDEKGGVTSSRVPSAGRSSTRRGGRSSTGANSRTAVPMRGCVSVDLQLPPYELRHRQRCLVDL